MKYSPIVLIVAFGLSACSPKSEPDAKTTIVCDGIGTCEAEVAKLAEVDSKLSTAFTAAITRIDHCAPSDSTRCYNFERAAELVRREQQRWQDWRIAHCDVFAFPMEGTSAHGELRAACRTDLAEKRMLELAKIMADEEA